MWNDCVTSSFLVFILFAYIGHAAWAETKRVADTIGALVVLTVLMVALFYGATHS
jgi:hypothetical protein